MKRIIGGSLIAAVLAGGATVAMAPPSSALPRDICMSEAQYIHQDGLFADHESATFDIYMAWQNADHLIIPISGVDMWVAHEPQGDRYVYGFADYNRVLTKIEALQGSIVNLSMKVDRLLAQKQEAAPAPPVRKPRRRKVATGS